jgi:ATP-dependent helicase/DNAse subunit B
MPSELLLAPVGAGKTGRALAEIVRLLRDKPFSKVWVLLPTRRQQDAFRNRLINLDPSHRVYFNVEFFDFYKLYARLLDIAGQPQRELDDTVRVHLLREILTDLRRNGELEVYGRIADKPGFVHVIAQFIYELKQNIIQPDEFGMASHSAKDHDLAKIYAGYQDKLRKYDLVDREGEGWLALATIASPQYEHIGRDVDLLIVDGFDQFNPLQTQLLALLASRADRALVTLATVRAREGTLGRRFEEARINLHKAYHEIGMELVERRVSSLWHDTRPSALRYLTDNAFLPTVTPRSSEGCLTLIEAPDPAQEAAAILRRVKRLLVEDGCAPDDILIAVRDWPRYAPHFATMGRVYGLPLSLHYGESVVENPAVIAVLNLLEVSGRDFRRRDLLDVLRSPYFAPDGLTAEWVDLLEKISLREMVIGGRDDWMDAIRLESSPKLDSDEDEDIPLLQVGEAEYLTTHLATFMDAVTPPLEATPGDYIRWLETLLGSDSPDLEDEPHEVMSPSYNLHLFQQLRSTTDDQTIISRDLRAIRCFKDVLRSLISAQNLFAALGMEDRSVVEWSTFLSDLKMALGVSTINRDANRAGKVLITTITDARGLPHQHILIPGLSEGIFPAPATEDPLYLDSERAALSNRGIPLETSAQRSADEGLFYELISGAQQTLTLSRPTVQNGALWPASHLWRAVCELFSDAGQIINDNRISLGGVVPIEDVACDSEALLAVADGLSGSELDPRISGLYNWLIAQRDLAWNHIQLGRKVELSRMGRGSFDQYSGYLRDKGLIEWVGDQLGARRVWSASQFNDYGMCGFRFFAKRLLKLEALEEPEDGLNAAGRGTINHAILEATYRRVGEMGLTITPENAETACQILREVAVPILADAPRTIGFRASVLWEQEQVTLLRKLEKLIELDFSTASPISKHFGDMPRQPYRLETPFSSDGRNALEIDLNTGLEPLRVTGYIDRMDRQGDRIILLDYKSGSTKIPTKDMRAGRNFQMMLYLLVADQVLKDDPDVNRPTDVAGGLFWHLSNRTTSGEFRWDNDQDREAITSAAERLTEQIRRGRSGRFGVQPGKGGHGPCSHYCEFKQLCRVSVVSRGKWESG